LVSPDRAGIVDINVDLVGSQRVEDDAGAEPVPPVSREPVCVETLLQQRGEDILF
jgi:hypothetical protein